MKEKRIIIGIAAVVTIIAAVIFGVVAGKQSSKQTTNTNAVKTTQTKKTEKTVTNTKYTDELSKEGAVKASQELLRTVKKSDTSIKTRLNLLSKSNSNETYVKALSQSARDKIRLIDFMNSDSRGRILTAQALLEVVQAIQENGNKNISATKASSYDTIVYFDKETKTATVPVDLYTTTPTNLNMTFVYIDGQWKFDPYNLISEISIRRTDELNTQSSTNSSNVSSVTKAQAAAEIQKALQKATK